MNKNKGSVSVGLVVLIAALAFAGGALVALFARPAPIGGFSGNSFLVPLVVEDTAEFNGVVTVDANANFGAGIDLSGTVTSTRLTANFLSNSTSTGFVFRGTNGNCYLLQAAAGLADTINWVTSTCQ